jgi:hypothetical protein
VSAYTAKIQSRESYQRDDAATSGAKALSTSATDMKDAS